MIHWAQAVASASNSFFLNIRISSIIQTSLLGDANKSVGAVFSLARKLRDANRGRDVIIFLDEVDGLLGTYTGQDRSSYYQIQTEFLQLWRGLGDVRHMILLAATNFPDSLSDSVRSRFTYREEVLCFSARDRLHLSLLLCQYAYQLPGN